MDGKSESLAMVFYDRIKLFNYKELLFPVRKIEYLLYGERVYDSKLQYRNSGVAFSCLLHILIRGRVAYYSFFFSIALDTVQGTCFRKFRKLLRPLLHEGVTADGVRGCHYIF